MFPYRRHGSKKRVKHGPGHGPGQGPGRHHPRVPHKGLPNSARDLLPLLQPATKALAQMLAGRTPSSGQLGHARTLLAQAERLIGERQHNRLNPGEREEFFEQLARLKLTLADAESEAELRAAEEQAPPRPAAQPVARERLKELALALASPEALAPSSPESGNDVPVREAVSPGSPPGGPLPREAEPEPREAEPERPSTEPDYASKPSRPGRLGLSEVAAREAASALMTAPVRRPVTSRRKRMIPVTEAPGSPMERDQGSATGAIGAPRAGAGNGAERQDEDESRPRGASPRRTLKNAPRKTQQGLPEGWVIDEDGFVVPGTS
jgi:hypothetical protein